MGTPGRSALVEKLNALKDDVALMQAAALTYAFNHWSEFAKETGLEPPYDEVDGYYHTVVRATAMIKADAVLKGSGHTGTEQCPMPHTDPDGLGEEL